MLHKIVLASLFLSTAAFANDAGCGLGSLVIKKNTVISQTFAITTNNTLSNQFFGITSGTSGCTASGFVKVDEEAKVYAESNMPGLKIDMARGQGESLTAFAQIIGCNEAAVPSFGQLVQSKYSQIFPNESSSAEQVVMAVRLELSRAPEVSSACTPRS